MKIKNKKSGFGVIDLSLALIVIAILLFLIGYMTKEIDEKELAKLSDNPLPGLECRRNSFGKCLKDYGYYKCDKQKMAKFVIECAKAANPMSDEEGEDLVKQCQTTSFDLFCERV